MRLFLCLILSLLLHGVLLRATGTEHARQLEVRPDLDVVLKATDPPEPAVPDEPMPDELATTSEAPVHSEPPLPPRPPNTSAEKTAPKHDAAAVRQARSKLMERLLYPPEAVAQGLEGEVILLLTLDANGRVAAASVARSSGHAVLDAAAMAAARSLGPLRSAAREILLPVEFALD